LLKRLLTRRLGALSPAVLKQINCLGSDALAQLAEALLDFRSPADLQEWLLRRNGRRTVA